MFDTFSGFLSGYFHQDWDLEYSSALGAAQDFGRTGALADVVHTIGEISVLLQSCEDEADIEKFLAAAGCYYRPVDSPLRDWLMLMSAELTEQAALRVE